MITCIKCSAELVEGENWSAGQVRNRSKVCRSCNSAKGKAWSKVNRERARSVAMKRRHSDPERVRAYKADYYRRNKDKWAGYQRNWRAANRTVPERRAQHILTFTQTRAKRKGLDCDLTLEFITDKLRAGVCEATGLPLTLADADRGKNKVHPFCPSLDRIDCHKGYVQSNVRMVAYIYNVAKADFSDAEVLQLARALVAKTDN